MELQDFLLHCIHHFQGEALGSLVFSSSEHPLFMAGYARVLSR